MCRQYDSFSTDVQAVNNSYYGKPRKPVHLSNVSCTGSEEQILFCAHTEFATLDEKKEALHKLDVAGVICQSNNTSGSRISSTSSGLLPTRTPVNQIEGNSNDAIEDPSGDPTTDASPVQSIATEIPNYLIALALFVCVVLAIM